MTAEPIDFAVVKAEHPRVPWMPGQDACDGHEEYEPWPCLIVRLVVEAERLVSERAQMIAATVEDDEEAGDLLRLANERADRAEVEAERLAGKVARVEALLGPEKGWRNEFRHLLVVNVRAALADQPEQVQP